MIVISGKTLMTVTVVIVKKHQKFQICCVLNFYHDNVDVKLYLDKRSTILSSIHLLKEGKRYPKSVNVYMYLRKRSTIQ